MHTVHYAKTHLSKLLEQVEDGKEIILARGRKPVARLVSCSEAIGLSRPKKQLKQESMLIRIGIVQF